MSVLGIPLQAPSSHPFNPLPALRLTLACPESHRVQLIDALFTACWSLSHDISAEPVLTEVLRGCGLDAQALHSAADTDAIKDRLRSETEAAVARGVFGVPSVSCDGELFFGFDDLTWLERFLRGDDTLDHSAYEAWQEIRPTAWRKSR